MQREDDLLRQTKALRERLSRTSEADLRINDCLDFDTVPEEGSGLGACPMEARCGVITVANCGGTGNSSLNSISKVHSVEPSRVAGAGQGLWGCRCRR